MDSLFLRADLTDIVSYLDTKARFRGGEAEKRESEWDQLLKLRQRKEAESGRTTRGTEPQRTRHPLSPRHIRGRGRVDMLHDGLDPISPNSRSHGRERELTLLRLHKRQCVHY